MKIFSLTIIQRLIYILKYVSFETLKMKLLLVLISNISRNKKKVLRIKESNKREWKLSSSQEAL